MTFKRVISVIIMLLAVVLIGAGLYMANRQLGAELQAKNVPTTGREIVISTKEVKASTDYVGVEFAFIGVILLLGGVYIFFKTPN